MYFVVYVYIKIIIAFSTTFNQNGKINKASVAVSAFRYLCGDSDGNLP